MSVTDARAALRMLGRKVRRLKNGRYIVQGVYGTVRECDLPILAQAFELKEKRNGLS